MDGTIYQMRYSIEQTLRDLTGHAIEVTTVNGLTFSGARWGVHEDLLMFFTGPGLDQLIGGSNIKVRIVPAHIVSIRVLPSEQEGRGTP